MSGDKPLVYIKKTIIRTKYSLSRLIFLSIVDSTKKTTLVVNQLRGGIINLAIISMEITLLRRILNYSVCHPLKSLRRLTGNENYLRQRYLPVSRYKCRDANMVFSTIVFTGSVT